MVTEQAVQGNAVAHQKGRYLVYQTQDSTGDKQNPTNSITWDEVKRKRKRKGLLPTRARNRAVVKAASAGHPWRDRGHKGYAQRKRDRFFFSPPE
jgi:hypothetical protein